jgi:Amt family ammonium transporter
MGTLILWVAWLFFNAGSTNDMFLTRTGGSAKIMMTTLVCPSIAGVVAVFFKPHLLGTYSFVNQFDIVAICGGILNGLVAITGCCDCVEVWAAFVIGIISGFVYILGCWFLERFHIDDPVEAIPVHFFGGMWGTIATGIFSNVSGPLYGFPGGWGFLGW